MKVVLAGAFGNLGADVLKKLVAAGHEVVAADLKERDVEGLEKKYTFVSIDVTNPETLKGICDGADVVVTTVGLTTTKSKLSNYDIDYKGNLNLLNEALAAGVKHFGYVSVFKATDAPENVAMLHSKALFEADLKKSGIKYTIYRPTGYFYDICRQFAPMIEAGKATLLGKDPISCNVISTEDFATFIVETMCDDNKMYDVGGKEVYTYDEIVTMMFEAAGKTGTITHAPIAMMKLIAFISHIRKNGKEAGVRFLIWCQTHSMVTDLKLGEMSFKQYIQDTFGGKK